MNKLFKQEFEIQLISKIKKYEKLFNEAKKDLNNDLNNDFIIKSFGLSSQAEKVVKYSEILSVLKEQQEEFNYICTKFKIKEGDL
jgi:hypothetical protein